jgi:hypothetical protein
VPTVALLNSHQTLGDFLESLIFARTVADRMDAKLAVQFANDRPYKRPIIGLLQGDKNAVYTGGADLVLETATSTATGASCRAWASPRPRACRRMPANEPAMPPHDQFERGLLGGMGGVGSVRQVGDSVFAVG